MTIRHRKFVGDFKKLVLGTEIMLNDSAIYVLFNGAVCIEDYWESKDGMNDKWWMTNWW